MHFFKTFYFFDQRNKDGDCFPDPQRLPRVNENLTGPCLEATLCEDGIWRVLELEIRGQIESVIYL